MFEWFMNWFRPTESERMLPRSPDWRLPCEHCGQIRYTMEVEIWSKACTKGRVVRICQECQMGCGA